MRTPSRRAEQSRQQKTSSHSARNPRIVTNTMPNQCQFPNCNIKKTPASLRGRSFHRIPTNEEQKQLWLTALGIDPSTPAESLKHLRVCSDHFGTEDFHPKKQPPAATSPKRGGLRNIKVKIKRKIVIERIKLKPHAFPKPAKEVTLIVIPPPHPAEISLQLFRFLPHCNCKTLPCCTVYL